MQNGSTGSTEGGRSFIGFYTDPELKAKVRRTAEEEGVSLSEWMRQQLRDFDHAADGAAATA